MTSESTQSAISLKRRVYEMIERPADGDEAVAQRHLVWFDQALATLILLNVAAVILETVKPIDQRWGGFFYGFEIFSVIVFSAEYLTRLWCCTADPQFAHPVWGRLRFAVRPMPLVDLLAILPSLILTFGADLRFVRALRLLRLLRVLKLGRYSRAVGLLGNVLRSRGPELAVMFLILMIVIVVAAGAVYYAEHEAQPEVFSSIPASMWWAVVTLTTIGYGDVYPVTHLGKLLGGIIAICGIGIVALPTAIIASGFSEELAARRRQRHAHKSHLSQANAHEDDAAVSSHHCPHCGKQLHTTIEAAGEH
ncbi:MAG TPA: ion transporter [Tepidisphaeraceae bacterium]|jgi:voltage-gated potassium channel|nr:ion transporter [Tepidisphaeraceae bacterium]